MSSLAEELPFRYHAAPCVFFDCDGVIFDSNSFKLEALREVLAGYPRAALEEMERFWSANGGMSRHVKFEHFFRHVLPLEDAAERVRETVLKFGELSRRAFVHANPVAEALLLARDAGPRRSFVVSGADQAELRDIFREKDLAGLFAEVCGSPTPKLDHVARILRERSCPPESALFIGDGGVDFEVCRALRVPFLYLAQFSDWRGAAGALAGRHDALAFDTWPELLSALGVAPHG